MWSEPTEADLLGVLNAFETVKYQEKAKANGQDVFRDTMTKIVDHCRGYIASNPANRLAAGYTLPDSVMLSALHLMRIELLTRLKQVVDEDRKQAGKDATRFLERIAENKFKIEKPEGIEESTQQIPSATIEIIHKQDRDFTRESLGGL